MLNFSRKISVTFFPLTRQIWKHCNMNFMELRSTPNWWMLRPCCWHTLLSIRTSVSCWMSATLFACTGSVTITSRPFCCCYVNIMWKLINIDHAIETSKRYSKSENKSFQIIELIVVFYLFNRWKSSIYSLCNNVFHLSFR